MKILKKIIWLFWLGIWAICTILIFALLVYTVVKYWGVFWELGIIRICISIVLGFVLLGLVTFMGYGLLKIIMAIPGAIDELDKD